MAKPVPKERIALSQINRRLRSPNPRHNLKLTLDFDVRSSDQLGYTCTIKPTAFRDESRNVY
ncbi:MAG: hypothetical protein RID09_24055 [Coleofasciculus sp. G1-WW12-02]|uniref:hypothetical protein n=1 Tax=Coleofasciculus sp. G1-WW12-02 TaxID=3068483 RepID=UPI0033022AA4